MKTKGSKAKGKRTVKIKDLPAKVRRAAAVKGGAEPTCGGKVQLINR